MTVVHTEGGHDHLYRDDTVGFPSSIVAMAEMSLLPPGSTSSCAVLTYSATLLNQYLVSASWISSCGLARALRKENGHGGAILHAIAVASSMLNIATTVII